MDVVKEVVVTPVNVDDVVVKPVKPVKSSCGTGCTTSTIDEFALPDNVVKYGRVCSRLDHPVQIKYGEHEIVLSPGAQEPGKGEIPMVFSKLGILPEGVIFIPSN